MPCEKLLRCERNINILRVTCELSAAMPCPNWISENIRCVQPPRRPTKQVMHSTSLAVDHVCGIRTGYEGCALDQAVFVRLKSRCHLVRVIDTTTVSNADKLSIACWQPISMVFDSKRVVSTRLLTGMILQLSKVNIYIHRIAVPFTNFSGWYGCSIACPLNRIPSSQGPFPCSFDPST
jgi:hypothetical protein